MDEARFWFQQSGFAGIPIGYSLRHRGAQYCRIATTAVGNVRLNTWSGWVKRSKPAAFEAMWTSGKTPSDNCTIGFNVNDQIYIAQNAGVATVFYRGSAAVFRDPNAWYHIVLVVDTGNANELQRLRVYVNGAEITTWAVHNAVPLNQPFYWNAGATTHVIGSNFGNTPSQFFDGCITRVHFVDGQALGPESFGEVDRVTGSWRAKDYTGSYGTNGFYLDYSDPANIGRDRSGNNHNFTPVGFQLTNAGGVDYDWLQDSPTNNWCTLNPLMPGTSTLTNGALTAAAAAVQPSIIPGSGSWYYEVNGAGYQWNGLLSSWTGSAGAYNFGQRPFANPIPGGAGRLFAAGMPASGLPATITGTFAGTGNANGPFVYTGCTPGRIQYGTVNVTYGNRYASNDVDFLSNGFKVRSAVSNSGTVNYTVTTTHSDGEHNGRQVPFGGAGRTIATAPTN